MDIAKKKLEVELEGGKFIFLDADIATFSKIIELRTAGKFLELYALTLEHLVGIENVFNGEVEIDLEQFKKETVSSSVAILLARHYVEALNKRLLSEFNIEPRQAEKNVESPIASNGSLIDHA